LDPGQGLAPGQRWQEELKRAGENCAAVIVLLSPNWVASRWCQTEFLVADQLGKRIFPVFVAPTSFDELPLELKAKFQLADISSPDKEHEGFQRLAVGLKRAGLDPKSFEWPPAKEPNRTVYRGLQALDVQDAAIFFGRDAAITRALDELRRMRDGAAQRMLVILGASGAGKSSFLRAGLMARLRRDEMNFLVLPLLRPERAALSGAQGLNASLAAALQRPVTLNSAADLAQAFAALRQPIVERLQRIAEAGQETYTAQPPTIIVPIDQAEEVFSADNTEREAFCDLVAQAAALDGNALIVATIRSDSYEALQNGLLPDRQTPFTLPAIAAGAFQEIIEGPARLSKPPLAIEPALTQQLLTDLDAADALPLLAFTLERLQSQHGADNKLTLADYGALGGLSGAILSAVKAVLGAQPSQSELALARRLFIPALVRVDQDGVKRRLARREDLPADTRALADRFIAQRLLVTDGGAIEVAHEAILRRWPALAAWVAEERGALVALDGVHGASHEWREHAGAGEESWLAHRGARLADAEELMRRSDFASAFSDQDRDYLKACRQAENDRLARERRNVVRMRRLQAGIGGLIAIAGVIVFVAAIGVARLMDGLEARAAATLAQLARAASDSQDYVRAARYAVRGSDALPANADNDSAIAVQIELARALSGDRSEAVLRGHEQDITAIAYNGDGSMLATASRDGRLRLWDPRATRVRALNTLGDGRVALTAVAFSRGGGLVAAGGDDGVVRVWDARAGTARAQSAPFAAGVRAAIFLADDAALAVLTTNGEAYVWSLGGGVRKLEGHTAAIIALSASQDGAYILTGSRDSTARLWTASGQPVGEPFQGHTRDITSTALSRDARIVLIGSDDYRATVVDRSTRARHVLAGHENNITSVALSPDATRAVTTSYDGAVRLWDVASGAEVAVLRGHLSAVTSAAFAGDGATLATASDDGTIRLWSATNGLALATVHGEAGPIRLFALSPDGAQVTTVSGHDAHLWRLRDPLDMGVAARHQDEVTSVRVTPDGARWITASKDDTAEVRDASTGNVLGALRHPADVWALDVSRDGALAATGAADGAVRIWNLNDFSEVRAVTVSETPVLSVAFSPDATRIVASTAAGQVILLDRATGNVLRTRQVGSVAVEGVAFAPDGARIAIASWDYTVRLLDAADLSEEQTLRGHANWVRYVVFSPDGAQLATASADQTARIWDVGSGREIAVLRGHTDMVRKVAFSPDGALLATTSWDGSARLWDAASGREIAALRGHRGNVRDVAFAPDGSRLLTASADGTARLWRVVAPRQTTRTAWREQACTRLADSGLAGFSSADLRDAPVLDPEIDANACRAPGFVTRLTRAIGF
jgi:WD40 repeat protein